jgi:hypothetical protein
MSDGKMDAHGVAALIKDYNAQLVIAQEKVENNIRNIEAIRTEMREATRELREAKEIYNSSWKCFLANHWLKGAVLLVIFFVGMYFLIDGKKVETTTSDGFTNKIEDLRTPSR